MTKSATAADKQRVLFETLVALLPPDKNSAPIGFLLGLLRTSVFHGATASSQMELERRIGMQLEEVTLEDLFIPSSTSPHGVNTLLDVDLAQRVVSHFMECGPQEHRSVVKVARLVDSYLAQIAPDANLSVPKFISLASLIPEYARSTDDGLYRAIDIYLKAHPSLGDVDRRKICRLMNCQKLSRKACVHAAQNERLSVQMTVQLLYFEQMRLRAMMANANHKLLHHRHLVPVVGGSKWTSGGNHPSVATLMSLHGSNDCTDDVLRENQELQHEIANMHARLKELETENSGPPMPLPPPPPSPLKQEEIIETSTTSKVNFFHSLSKTLLGKLNPFQRKDPISTSKKEHMHVSSSRRRRYSIS